MHQLCDLLQPPAFEEIEEKQTAETLYRILLGLLALSFLVFGLAPLLTAGLLRTWFFYAGIVLALLASVWLTRRRSIRAGGFLLVSVVWTIFVTYSLLSGGLHGPSMGFLVSVVLIAGFFLGERVAIVCTLVSSLAVMGLAFADQHAIIPPPFVPFEPWRVGAEVTALLTATMVILYGGLWSIRTSLEQAKRNYRRLSELVQESPDGIVCLDEQGVIEQFNPAAERIVGIPTGEALGKRLSDLKQLGANTLEIILSGFERILAGKQCPLLEFEFTRADRSTVAVESHARRIISGEGSVGVQCLIRDITERRKLEQIRAKLSQKVIEIQESERRRVARELHDGVNQILSSARFRIQSVAARCSKGSASLLGDVRDVGEVLGIAIEEVRRISRNLRPCVLDELGLVAALQSLCDEVRDRTGLDLDLHTECRDLRSKLFPEVEVVLFRIAQEALLNVEKHAAAKKVQVELRHDDSAVSIQISDDGKGFMPSGNMLKGDVHGYGLAFMEERVHSFEGSLSTVSGPGEGTRITARIPLKSPLERDAKDADGNPLTHW